MFQDFIEILILSAIQGLSEFLPISSSAHLILVSNFYDFKSSSLLIDISLHLGSLFAIVFYFRKELFDLRNNQKILILLIIGSIPLIVFGYFLHATELIYLLRNPKVIAFTTLFFGLILYFADQRKIEKNISKNLNIKSILFIGLFQILSLIPGMSRAGTVITASRFLGYTRVFSIKLALLTSIPIIFMASSYGLYKLLISGQQIYLSFFFITFTTFVISFFSIKFLLKWINFFSFRIFVIYRLCFGIILLVMLF